MAEGPPLIDLKEVCHLSTGCRARSAVLTSWQIDSAFQLTEHLKALHHHLTHPQGAAGTVAVDKDIAYKLAQPPDNVDRTLWLYELCRFLTQKANSMVISLFSDDPPCSANTCPEMRASEWQYLCAVHEPPKACCAIDYCCHTLDWAANTLTSTKTFPSRLAMGTDANSQYQQMRHLTNIFRRVYRIFAHAWFQHRDMFWKVEGRTGLYILFKTVCDVYGLIPEESYTIPSEAEGLDALQPAPPMILRREPSGPSAQEPESTPSLMEGMADHSLSSAGTTKRHRHSPSVGAMSVDTVVEETEEEEESSGAATHSQAQEETADVGTENTAPSEERPTAKGADETDETGAPAVPEMAEEPKPAEEQSEEEEKHEESSPGEAGIEGAGDEGGATEVTDSGADEPTEGQPLPTESEPAGDASESAEGQDDDDNQNSEASEAAAEKADTQE
jgi:hypothetical protein